MPERVARNVKMEGLAIRGGRRDFLGMSVVRRQYEPTGDVDDDNWLVVQINVSAGSFQGHVDATMRTQDFEEFAEALAGMEVGKATNAGFSSLEPWITFEVARTEGENLEVSGWVADSAIGNRLSFRMDVSPDGVTEMRTSLARVLERFPSLRAE